MSEETNCGMEMRVKTPQEQIEEIVSEEQAEQLAIDEAQEKSKFKLKRTDQGLMISTEDDAVEVSSPFAMLEAGDDVNHQVVESVEEVDGKYIVHLDYFGQKTEISSEEEVFSIFLKEQRDAFKRAIVDFVKSFDGKFDVEYLLTEPEVVMLATELLCAGVDMNSIDGILVGNEGVDLALASILGMTLKKPVYIVERDKKFEPEEQTNVILFTYGYVKKAVDDVLDILGKETKFYVSYQLSLFEADFLNENSEYTIVDDNIRNDLDRSRDIVIIGGNN